MASITFENTTKIFKNGVKAVDSLNIDIQDGEFIVLVGPSGCGKTTALRMVAGLEEITSGEIIIGDNVVNNVDPGERDIAMVFQNYALYPHMTVFDNIAFPLQCQKVSKTEIKERVNKIARLLGLGDYLSRKPRTLSGGQRQRVAMGRALVREPQAFLMDEPLSNLDAKLRVQMRAEISTLQAELGITTIYVTHDQVEAMTMGSRIAVMRRGVLQQYGTPQEVYDEPANIFVASFIGSPGMNLIKAGVINSGECLQMAIGKQTVNLPKDILQKKPALMQYEGNEIVLGIRPEHLKVGIGSGATFKAHVTRVEMLGSEKLVYASLEGEAVLADEVIEMNDTNLNIKNRLDTDEKNRYVNLIIKETSDINIKVGNDVDIEIRPGCMHFFALDNGKAIVYE